MQNVFRLAAPRHWTLGALCPPLAPCKRYEQGAYPRSIFLEEYGPVGGVRERGAVSIEVALKPLVGQLAWGYIPLVCMSSRMLSASTLILALPKTCFVQQILSH